MYKIYMFINIIMLMFISGGFYSDSSILLILISLINFFILIYKIIRSRFIVSLNKYLTFSFILFVIYIIASTIWSSDALFTIKSVIKFLGTIIFSINLFLTYKEDDFYKFILYFTFFSTIVTILLVLFFPSIGTYYDERNFLCWRGYFSHKNGFGRTMAIGFIFTMLYMIKNYNQRKKKYFSLAVMLLSLICVYNSKSSTAFIIILIPIVMLIFKKIVNLPILIIIFYSIYKTFVDVFILNDHSNFISSILERFGRDLTLTGRSEIWKFSFQAIKIKSLLGFGYQAFWFIDPYSYLFEQYNGFMVGHSHNGYIDVFLNLGIVGFVIFIIVIVQYILESFRLYRQDKNNLYSYSRIMFIFIYMFINLSEGEFLRTNSIFLVIFVCMQMYAKSFFLKRNKNKIFKI